MLSDEEVMTAYRKAIRRTEREIAALSRQIDAANRLGEAAWAHKRTLERLMKLRAELRTEASHSQTKQEVA